MHDSDHTRESEQLLHLVFGGELKSLDGVEFRDISTIDVVGVFPNYASAYAAWKAKAEHLAAQKLGRERWYAAYTVRIAKVEREYSYVAP